MRVTTLKQAFVALLCTIACAQKTPSPAVAHVNGLPVFQADYVAALQSGRLGGSPELVLDELINLTLVLHECEVLEGHTACSGPGTVLDRARAFLDRLFPPVLVCNDFNDIDYAMVYERLAGRRFPKEADPFAPEIRLSVESELCRAKIMKVQRSYVQALRKDARVVIDRNALEAANKEAI